VYKLITGPTSEPIPLFDAKLHLKVDVPDDDVLISSLIVAAREVVEGYTNLQLLPAVWETNISSFNERIQLFKSPVTEIVSINYKDEDGADATLATDIYTYDFSYNVGTISLAYEKQWPSVYYGKNNIRIRFKAGFQDSTKIPQSIKQAMLLMIGSWYENREDSISKFPKASEMLLQRYRIFN
jgi:uncharacterized phiE125 gp8 family phage protein